jgi:hypothetical protein
MKKLIVILLLLLLTGCKAPVTQPNTPRLVTRVRIQTEDFTREYTDTEKITAVLDYLRFLPKYNPSVLNPDWVKSRGISIELTYLTGKNRTYVQKGVFYLSQDKEPFRPIDPDSARALIRLLETYPSDDTIDDGS